MEEICIDSEQYRIGTSLLLIHIINGYDISMRNKQTKRNTNMNTLTLNNMTTIYNIIKAYDNDDSLSEIGMIISDISDDLCIEVTKGFYNQIESIINQYEEDNTVR